MPTADDLAAALRQAREAFEAATRGGGAACGSAPAADAYAGLRSALLAELDACLAVLDGAQ
ncbi:hypothetical protein [Actinokineospora xionganensis]|uniref:Uncharacterized protein n=1 Tax=Actinokineospora xionganensis TaxID=2684470 RepID=A0ABR7LAS0_9PSEU|nr:hypothetical protein [Actinokineospora xionganensis]MBC6449739.1 hypothetical protein [Actinokineospora xionganensis]